MPERVRAILSMGLFVILSGFVAFSAVAPAGLAAVAALLQAWPEPYPFRSALHGS